jgi:hypothetical protein
MFSRMRSKALAVKVMAGVFFIAIFVFLSLGVVDGVPAGHYILLLVSRVTTFVVSLHYTNTTFVVF